MLISSAGRKALKGGVAVLGFFTAITLPALAQAQADQGSTIETIVVTAQKRTEELKNVPISETVITGDELSRRATSVVTTGTLLMGVPGVQYNNTGSTSTSEVSCRGSGSSRATSADSGVGLYRDGAYIEGGQTFGRNFAQIDLFDISRAEVLRGTQAALYGRNAVGCAINVITAKPNFNGQSGYADLTIGEPVNLAQEDIIENLPLTDHFALRVSLRRLDKNDSFIKDVTHHIGLHQYHGYMARVQLRYRAGDFDTNLLVEKQEMQVPIIVAQTHIDPSLPNFPFGYTASPFNYQRGLVDRSVVNVQDVVWTADYNLHWADLSAIVSYRDRYATSITDNSAFTAAELAETRAAGNPAAGQDTNVFQAAVDRTDSTYAELHLTGTTWGKLKWLIGGDYLHITNPRYIILTRTPTANPSYGVYIPSGLGWVSMAAYGSLGYDITDNLNVTGEFRYTNDSKHFDTITYSLGANNPLDPYGAFPQGFYTTGVLKGLQARKDTFPNKSYNLIVKYHFIPSMMVYAKMGTGYRVGGFNSNPGDPRAPNPVQLSYDDEKSTVWEAGVKGDLLPNLYTSLDYYYTRVNNVLAQISNGCAPTNPVCPVQVTNFVGNSGKAQVQGVEAEANGHFGLLGGNLNTITGVSWQEGKFLSGSYSGRSVPQLPHWIWSASLNYTHPVDHGRMTAFGNVDMAAQWGGSQDVSTPYPISQRAIFNFRGGVDIDSFEVAAYVTNFTDQTYIINYKSNNIRYETGRTYGFEVRYSW